jgi:hypothetical protein
MIGADCAVGVAYKGAIDVGALAEGLARRGCAIPTVVQSVGVEYELPPTGEDVELVAYTERGEVGGAESAAFGVAVDDGVGEEGHGLGNVGQKELHGVGVFHPLLTEVGNTDPVDISSRCSVN